MEEYVLRWMMGQSWRGPSNTAEGPAYADMTQNLRDMLDLLAGARPDAAMIAEFSACALQWSQRLSPLVVNESDQVFARLTGVPGHGQVMCPPFTIDDQDETSVSGRVTFGRFFLGANGATHGGAVALVFDEVMGMSTNAGVSNMARTAYLHVD